MTNNFDSLPPIIAGPIVRHIAQDTFTLWMVTSLSIDTTKLRILLFDAGKTAINVDQSSLEVIQFQMGSRCFITTVVIKQGDLFQDQSQYFYDVHISPSGSAENTNESTIKLSQCLKHMLYNNQSMFSFKYSAKLSNVLHGSCRKPHFKGKDALPQLDVQIENSLQDSSTHARPDLMLFTGDQVYVDDVAGPMLHAIHQVIELLGLYHEDFEGSTVSHSSELFEHADSFYGRNKLLPKTKANKNVAESFFKGKHKPVFTSVNALNHLISLNEMLALYLLSWSSRLWKYLDLNKSNLNAENAEKYAKEQKEITKFSKGLKSVERALAHIPVYMIFDDHDVTDDWNLTREWEEQVYSNPFSRQIVGNALLAYFLCQGLGNPKVTWESLIPEAKQSFTDQSFKQKNKFIDTLFDHSHWHYKLDTTPPIQVLDTRTQRWRSESNPNKPSGLMDWEALCELQQDIIGHESVIMVSAAPVYGVKFIEAIQRAFITFGGALMVDAENWMAHRGTASVMLNIFRHMKTPPNFIILSGDVHYSFVYDISLRFRRNSPKIIQFTCSGIHNQFPDKLIKWFERLNRWFYSRKSPLNWLTKRRNMSINERAAYYQTIPTTNYGPGEGKDIVNATSIGLLELDKNANEQACKLILADGSIVKFKQND